VSPRSLTGTLSQTKLFETKVDQRNYESRLSAIAEDDEDEGNALDIEVSCNGNPGISYNSALQSESLAPRESEKVYLLHLSCDSSLIFLRAVMMPSIYKIPQFRRCFVFL
jgi:hypothetical protein